MEPERYDLADRFTAESGTVFLSGVQALARIPIDQLRADRRAGLRTAAFVSGYPGSPLGGFDTTMRGAARLVPELPIECRPAVNEEYGATAVMGSQLVATQPDRRYDGVVGIWYGKAPGVDRAADAMRHAVYAGTASTGGGVAFVGDDPNAKSSTLPSSSAGVLSDLHMPMLYPADPGEVLELGRHAVALSRLSGLWTAMKIVADVADGTASVDLDPERPGPVLPAVDGIGRPRPPEGRLLTPLSLDLEREIYEVRYRLAIAYAAANDLNRVTAPAADGWIGIAASGITYRELREAFRRLGLPDEAAIERLGIRLLKLQLPLPFDPETVRAFARGLEEVFVVEEKQPNIELLVKDALYAVPGRPRVVGKLDELGQDLIPGFGALDADALVPALRARLGRVANRLAPAPTPRPARAVTSLERAPFYCSGCPHNRSTTSVPEGALVGAGIGCHTMTLVMDPKRVGNIAGITCMGNEGTQWIGMAPFVDRPHLIQNLGDGTYFHSGQLAITAAVAAGVNITFKLLYNGAVAMTGGQHPEGQRSVASVAATLRSQGVSRVLVTTDDVTDYRGVALPRGVDVWPRERLLEAQELLATVPGVTVLIHDQACAAELRRARKRGRIPAPTRRVVINHRVCEGCGDCGEVSNCLSVQPFETPFGRKTRVDQTTCNFDYSCLGGDCPSFVTVETRSPRWWRRRTARGSDPARDAAGPSALDALLATEPPSPIPLAGVGHDVTIRMVGIGGTGVVTVAQVIGTAAMLDGYHVRGLDQIGLSQKAGPVVSDLHLARGHDPESSRLGAGQADVLLVFDALVAASRLGVSPADRERTALVGSTSQTPPGAAITDPTVILPSVATLEEILDDVTRPDHRHWVDADAVATLAFGNTQAANVLVAGMAVQSGAVPVTPGSVEQAIVLNGTAAERNLAAFRLGRHLIADRTRCDEVLGAEDDGGAAEPPLAAGPLRSEVDALHLDGATAAEVARLADDLAAYQDPAYADDFLALVRSTRDRERAAVPDSTALTCAVARSMYRLMAYKDEYEVARLLLDEDAHREALAVGGTVRYHLHPPVLRSMGLSHKLTLGPWFVPVLRGLTRAKRLRGTALDPFGRATVRRVERALPREYRIGIEGMLPMLDATNLERAVEVAMLPDTVRGYEQLKLRRAEEYRARFARALTEFARPEPADRIS